jgi:NTE family protein
MPLTDSSPAARGSPANLAEDPARRGLEDGNALCLSGGGYRAMLFHVGVLWRFYELGLLQGMARISGVSGGSITAGCWLWPGRGWASIRRGFGTSSCRMS